MKLKNPLAVMLTVCMFFVIAAGVIPAGAQKTKQAVQGVTFADLDDGAQLNVGKSVFYTPTVAEGCDSSSPQGCKYPAVITGVPTRISHAPTWEFIRTTEGHIAVHLTIFRPANKGGTFDKEFVGFTSSPIEGTCRSIQSEDLRGVL